MFVPRSPEQCTWPDLALFHVLNVHSVAALFNIDMEKSAWDLNLINSFQNYLCVMEVACHF